MGNFPAVHCLRPGMLRSLPSRLAWLFKPWIRERPDGDADQVRAQLGFPEHCSSALRAEAEVHHPAAFRHTYITPDVALDGLHVVSRIPRLNAERASGPAL